MRASGIGAHGVWLDGAVPRDDFSFRIDSRLESPDGKSLGRAGTIETPHGVIRTPAFTPVGTKATVKSVLPETMRELGAQVILANAYHLYLQPGPEIIDQAGGVSAFMNWNGPTITDSGGFQVMSLGVGFKKVLAMDTAGMQSDDVIAKGKDRLAKVDDDGVTFKSHLDGSKHRFTPEVSMQVQHQLGADIIMAFDECTTLMNTRGYQEQSLDRTYAWALRCIAEHERLTRERVTKPYQALFGVIQGAQYEDLRRKAARDLGALEFDGYGIGGALDKHELGTIVGWVSEELPEHRPRHLLGIGEPEDIFVGVENGADTFDCVAASRIARNGTVYHPNGRFHISNARYKADFNPIQEGCDCYTCLNHTRAYVNHLHKSKEMLASTLATIHNERYILRMVDAMREAIISGDFHAMKTEVLGRLGGRK
jgi:queuine tRNA-ribosyltransferase